MTNTLKRKFLINYATKELKKESNKENSLLSKAINEYLSKTKTKDTEALYNLIDCMFLDLINIYANCKNINLHLSVDIITEYFK